MKRKQSPIQPVQRGFTLVELTVVLAVIGLILSGIAVARDLIREAEAKKVYQFVTGWKSAYDIYFQRTGVVVGDSQIAPTYMVSGAEAMLDNRYGRTAGIPQNYTQTGLRLCHGQGYEAGSVGEGDPTELSEQNLHHLMERAGVTMPSGRAEGQEDRFLYQDSNGNPLELQICFQWNPDGTISGAGNVMVVRGLTPDMARRLDRMIDGYADALEGRFREQDMANNLTQDTNREPGREWSTDNTFSYGSSLLPTSFFGVGERRDEDRVTLVTAHWKMDS